MSKCSSLLAHARGMRPCFPAPLYSSYRHLPRCFSSTAPSSSNGHVASKDTEVDNDPRPIKFPDLMQPDVLYDSAHTRYYRGPRSRRVVKVNLRNDPSYMAVDKELNEMLQKDGNVEMFEEKDANIIINDRKDVASHVYPLIQRRVTQQTGKGKKHRTYVLIVVGNGDGLVGYGEGKHEEYSEAYRRAFIEGVRNMDAVERFEHRTIWTDLAVKFGSTRILMRPRPVGFGLHCNPNIHQVLKAAGIKDVSAKVWGSRNPIQVIKSTCMLIQSGNAPLSMGNGIGGKGRRLDAGSGMRGKESVERDRGRKLVDGRTW